jgi:Icc-related predicted phosphoesterase
MRILAISDLHGDLGCAWEAVEAVRPDLLICCGDWGDPGEVSPEELARFTERLPVLTIFGNHDDLDALHAWMNRDGSPVLLAAGEVRDASGIRIAGISGIWAKSHRKPFYVTDEDVERAAVEIASHGRVDVLLTHGCPLGVADLTWQNRHGGQRCFLEAFRTVQPRVHLTGHLHRPQEHRTREGQVIRNVGATPQNPATVITWNEEGGLNVSVLSGVGG